MPVKDFHHEIVKKALFADGWTITHDPYYIQLFPFGRLIRTF